MITDIKAKVEQYEDDVAIKSGQDYPTMSKIGQLWTADWKYKLAAAGKCYRMSLGTISGGTDVVPVGDATSGINLDQPEGIVTVSSGFLIPIELEISGTSLADAAADNVQIMLCADRSGASPAASLDNGTEETVDNLLDGGPTFGGTATGLITSDVTDPTVSDIIHYRIWQTLEPISGTATQNSITIGNFYDHWVADIPTFLAGPCDLLLYAAGVIAFTFVGSLVFAHVPASWVPTS